AEVLYLRGLMARIRGELEHAATLITRALELHRELAESDQIIDDLTVLGRVAQDRGEWDKARLLYEQARELAGELGVRSAEAELVRHLGLLALFRGDLDRAEQLLRQALESYREQGHRAGTVLTLGNLGVALMDQGRLEESESLLLQEHELLVRMGNHSDELISLSNLTEIARLSDEHAKCQENAGQALSLLDQHEAPIVEVHLSAARAYCLLRSGEVSASEAALRHASEVADQIENPLPRAAVALAWADHHAYLGRAREAESWMPMAEDWLDKSPGWDLAGDLFRIRARIAYLRGRFPAAVENTRRAKELAGPVWQPYDQELLDAYESSARSGRPLPLPSAPDSY
ncbi:MAG: tetratricopeptide repeat protein, partial [bacterium]|nr:tetratricopeptide repeat protein [bacterium]